MTVITVVAIAAILALFTVFVLPRIRNNLNKTIEDTGSGTGTEAGCTNAGFKWVDGKCQEK